MLRVISFITEGIWKIRLDGEPAFKRLAIRSARIVLLSVQGFIEDNCPLRASALTYFTLVSIVPIAALVFGIAKGFELDRIIQNYLLQNLKLHEDVLLKVISFSARLIEETKGGIIAGIGFIVLLWAAIRILITIEVSFNEIWKIRKARPFTRKLTDYTSFMIIGPFLFLSSVSATLWLSGKARELLDEIPFLNLLIPAIVVFLGVLLLWVLFTFLYIVVPNTRVPMRSAVVAGISAGTIYQLAQWIYIYFQTVTTKYGAVYGSFAALPLFLIWLQISWYIVLFGAEVSFAYANSDTYGFLPCFSQISAGSRRILILRVVQCIEKNFLAGGNALRAAEISQMLEIPGRLVSQILHELTESGLVVESINQENGRIEYTVGKNPDAYTMENILSVSEKLGVQLPERQVTASGEIVVKLGAIKELVEKSPLNVNLKDI